MGMPVSKTSGAAPLSLASLEADSTVAKEMYEESSNESVNLFLIILNSPAHDTWRVQRDFSFAFKAVSMLVALAR